MVPYGFPKRYSRGTFEKAELKAATWCVNGGTGYYIPLANQWQVINIPNNIGAGTDIYQRDGRQITLKSILLRMTLNNEAGYAYPLGGPTYYSYQRKPQTVRLLLIYDRYTNGTLPTGADIFQTAQDNGGSNIAPIEQTMNLKNRYRFKVLWDKNFTLGNTTSNLSTVNTNGVFAGGGPSTICVKKYIKLKNRRTTYGGTTNAIASLNEGGLFLLACTNVYGPLDGGAPAVGEAAGIAGTSRLRFTG